MGVAKKHCVDCGKFVPLTSRFISIRNSQAVGEDRFAIHKRICPKRGKSKQTSEAYVKQCEKILFRLLAGTTKRAAIIAINDYLPPFDRLAGPVNDGRRMSYALIDLLGFSKDNIKLLENKDATKANIDDILHDAFNCSELDDTYFFAFFGVSHKRNIVLADNELMSGEELGNKLQEIASKCRNVCAFFDTCGGSDLVRIEGADVLAAAQSLEKRFPPAEGRSGGMQVHGKLAYYFCVHLERHGSRRLGELADWYRMQKSMTASLDRSRKYMLPELTTLEAWQHDRSEKSLRTACKSLKNDGHKPPLEQRLIYDGEHDLEAMKDMLEHFIINVGDKDARARLVECKSYLEWQSQGNHSALDELRTDFRDSLPHSYVGPTAHIAIYDNKLGEYARGRELFDVGEWEKAINRLANGASDSLLKEQAKTILEKLSTIRDEFLQAKVDYNEQKQRVNPTKVAKTLRNCSSNKEAFEFLNETIRDWSDALKAYDEKKFALCARRRRLMRESAALFAAGDPWSEVAQYYASLDYLQLCEDGTFAASVTPDKEDPDHARWLNKVHIAAKYNNQRINVGDLGDLDELTFQVFTLLRNELENNEKVDVWARLSSNNINTLISLRIYDVGTLERIGEDLEEDLQQYVVLSHDNRDADETHDVQHIR